MNPAYRETLTSARTEALFLLLTALFFALSLLRLERAGPDLLAAVFLFFFAFFLFYALNYRRLEISIASGRLLLRFGLFTWRQPLNEIAACRPDEVSLLRIGGAGIHFTWIKGRYRAMFNFLEYPRVVIVLKAKRGPVQEVAFSTRRAEEVMRWIGEVEC